MKKTLLIGMIGLLAHTLCAADSQDAVAKASKELADKPNYSWTTTTKDADGSTARLGPISGKAEKAGVTYLTFDVSEVPVEVYMKGEKGTAKALEGWQTFDDISQTGSAQAAIVKFLKAYKTPAADAAELAKKAKDLKESDGAFSGELKEDSVKDLLLTGARRREGQDPPKVTGAKGTVKFWIKDNLLTKYETNIQGKVSAGDRDSDINRTTTVEIKDAGTTKVEVPAEAKEKMT